jgi:hypothetical protein
VRDMVQVTCGSWSIALTRHSRSNVVGRGLHVRSHLFLRNFTTQYSDDGHAFLERCHFACESAVQRLVRGA